MSQWRDYRSSLEAGRRGEIAEQENEREMDALQDRVNLLKRLTTDIHQEAEAHTRILDHMSSSMDSARGLLSGTVNRFKRVFETKSGRNMFTIVASFVIVFLLIYLMVK